MSAEKIIQQIKKDSDKQIQAIQKEAEQQGEQIRTTILSKAQQEAEKIREQGKIFSENKKKILISQTVQDLRRTIMKTKEDIIENCFTQAQKQITQLPEPQYNKIVTTFIQNGKRKLGNDCTIYTSRDIDKKLAEQHNLHVKGTIPASGGVMLQSADGKISIDNTFDGILKRKKEEIRVQIGKLIFG